jgi:hypothetical protein
MSRFWRFLRRLFSNNQNDNQPAERRDMRWWG